MGYGGMLTAQLISADPESALRYITQQGIRLNQVTLDEDLTVRFCVEGKAYPVLCDLCRRRGYHIHITEKTGIYWKFRRLLHRPVLMGGVLGLFALTLLLPARVLFLQVEGNDRIPTDAIVEAAQDSGLSFGTSRRNLRSERIKNRLLQAIPELSWVGVNTKGCTALISVREKPEAEITREEPGIKTIVAARDGLILSCVASRGTALCAPGQTVRKGQTLISPYTDCGIAIRVNNAQGEIYAQTLRVVSAITPDQRLIRVREGERIRKYSLIIGKKRINFWKDSGICDASCGRMYEEYYITLPGGFRLPLRVGITTVVSWQSEPEQLSQQDAIQLLRETIRRDASAQMVCGEILKTTDALSFSPGQYRMDAQLLCREMIGRTVIQQIGDTHG